jgi:hypothetical protein
MDLQWLYSENLGVHELGGEHDLIFSPPTTKKFSISSNQECRQQTIITALAVSVAVSPTEITKIFMSH